MCMLLTHKSMEYGARLYAEFYKQYKDIYNF